MKPVSGSSGPGPQAQGVGLSHAPGQAKKEEKAEGKSGEKSAVAEAPKPSMEEAIQKLDVALQKLANDLKTDGYEGAPPPTTAPAASTVPNPLETMTQSTFSEPVASFAPTAAAGAANPLADPILNEKGGGGAMGGVTSDTSYLRNLGGGGAMGGVTSD